MEQVPQVEEATDAPISSASPFNYKGAGKATTADLGCDYISPTQAQAPTAEPVQQPKKPTTPLSQTVRDEVLPTPVPEEVTPSATPIPVEPAIAEVDISTLNTTMVCAKLSDMCSYPENYVGKVVKMTGTYSSFTDEASGTSYYSCTCKDATACCQMGLEFKLVSGAYPTEGATITVMGTFQTYLENGTVYCQLVGAKLC